MSADWFFLHDIQEYAVGKNSFKINRHLLLRSPGNTDKAVLDGLNLVDAVLVAEDVEHAKHLVQGGHNLHPIALLANVPGNPGSLRFC